MRILQSCLRILRVFLVELFEYFKSVFGVLADAGEGLLLLDARL